MHRLSILALAALAACGTDTTPRAAASPTDDAPTLRSSSPPAATAAAASAPAAAASAPQADTARSVERAGPSPAPAARAPDERPRPRPVAVAPASRPAPDGEHARQVPATGIVRGLYVNRWAAQSTGRMRSLMAIADTTEINALVIDIKDEFGINYRTSDSIVLPNAGRAGAIPGLPALLDTMKARGIIPIARIVVFKDSVAARVNPEHVIRTADGGVWRDREGLAWVNPYDRAVWEYNIRVAEEVARMGFAEIQFDYIRFPEPYRSLPTQVFPGSDGVGKADALVHFLEEACPRIRKLGALCTADIFGLVTTVRGTLEVGQNWEKLAPVSDVLLPMVYPSHYPRGSFGIDRPNAEPRRVIREAIVVARERNERLGIRSAEHVRPWLQAFTLGAPPYGADEIVAQKEGVYDAGYDGWILWHPGSLYGPFLAGLEREAVSRKRLPGSERAEPVVGAQ